MLKWRYRDAVHADTEEDHPRPLYWQNREGWTTEEDATDFSTFDILHYPCPVDGYPEPQSTIFIFKMSSDIVVEVLDTLTKEEREHIENEWQAVWSEQEYYPDTDEDAVHETMKRLGIQMYRILETHTIMYD